jgi:sugar lactone lactonase YvrE
MVGYEKTDYGRSGLFAFDLMSGKLARKTMLPADEKRHLLNTLAIDHDGNVYVSDTGASGIYLLRRVGSTLEEFLPASAFEATQGLALSEDEKTLFVADYASGLWAVDIASRRPRKLDTPRGTWLGGLDGISPSQGGFIAVQIGVKPERVLRIRVDRKATRVTSVEILEMNHPAYEGPIQGMVAGQSFLYVANSQLDLGDAKTGRLAAERAHPTVVLRLPL